MLGTKNAETNRVGQDVREAAYDSEELVKTAAREQRAEEHTLRLKLEAAIEKGKAVCERLQEKTTAAAKAADKTVREHPYQAIGIALGIGLLVGVLAARSRRSSNRP